MTQYGAGSWPEGVRVLSFGGGVQTTALAVMWVRGEIEADIAVMSDTGGETPETYQHVDVVARFLAEHGERLEIVTHADGVSLEDWTLTRSTPIPIRTRNALGHRQCTNKWKIEPVKRYARNLGAKHLTMILGISLDEYQRMKPDREKWVTREYPLIDCKLTRADCREIVREAGLPDPPKSACFYCPLQGGDRWRWLAAEHPDLFARSEALEAAINTRRSAGDTAYLTSKLVPLREIVTAGAMLPGMAEECEGVCFV